MNYYKFIEKYKNTSYKDKKITEIDVLIYSQLAYLPLDNIDFTNNKKYSLIEIANKINRKIFLESLIAQRAALSLLDATKTFP